MTTGRINQVTTIRLSPKYSFPHRSFPSAGVHHNFPRRWGHKSKTAFHHFLIKKSNVLTSRAINDQTTLFPRSHKVQTHFSLSSNGTEITAFDEDYQQPAAPERHTQPRRIPEWLIDWQAWPSASNPHPSLIASPCGKRTVLDWKDFKRQSSQQSNLLSPVSTSRSTGISMTRSLANQPPVQGAYYYTRARLWRPWLIFSAPKKRSHKQTPTEHQSFQHPLIAKSQKPPHPNRDPIRHRLSFVNQHRTIKAFWVSS